MDVTHVMSILPRTKQKIVEMQERKNWTYIRLYTDCHDEDQIKFWVTEFERITKTSYSIRHNPNPKGRYVNFKQILKCRRNTRSKPEFRLNSTKNSTRNTNCPSTITITLHAIKKRYQGKNKELYLLRKEFPCEISIILTHNHNTESVDDLKHLKVRNEVTEKLVQLFRNGHSPATALDSLKMDIYLSNDCPKLILADRSQCPDYIFCYRLYIREFKKKYEPLDFTATGKEFLKKRLEEYNLETDSNSAQIIFKDSQYIICICSPLMKRVHKYIKSASEIVFMDSLGTVDHDGSRFFVLLTYSECGGLPLGVIITSTESCELIKCGFQLLKNMLGEEIFGGNPEGPILFMTGDSLAEQRAILETWTRSKCLLCIFHVLQAVRRWLVNAKNRIPQSRQNMYLEDFKAILYAETVDDCIQQYEAAKSHVTNNINYLSYLESYWSRKEHWALAYRSGLETKENNTNNLSEAVMRMVKEKMFNRVKAFNDVQMVDFILNKFDQYYKVRLLDSLNNRLRTNILGKNITIPSPELLEQVTILNDTIVLVPSETNYLNDTEVLVPSETNYIVNMDALMCSCFEGNTGKICKHIDWACLLLYSEQYNMVINNDDSRKIFYIISTGSESPGKYLEPLYENVDSRSSQTIKPDLDSYDNIDFQIQQELPKQSIAKGKSAIKGMVKIFTDFLDNDSTNDIANGLEKMYATTKKIRTVADFLSCCSNFAIDYPPKKKRVRIPVQPTAISRRKTNLSSRNSHVAVRLRPLKMKPPPSQSAV